jgi:hypothetical protein
MPATAAASPGAPPRGGPTPAAGSLWAAAHAGDVSQVEALLACGADPNERDDAAAAASTAMGAAATRQALSALHWAAWKGRAAVVDALLRYGADHASVNKWGKTPLHWAAWMGHSDVASVLMRHGADVSTLDTDGWTPLHLAARFNHAPTVAVLLRSGATPDIPDRDGQTARELARQLNYMTVVEAIDAHQHADRPASARPRGGRTAAAVPQLPLPTFEEMDRNRDGVITRDEYDAAALLRAPRSGVDDPPMGSSAQQPRPQPQSSLMPPVSVLSQPAWQQEEQEQEQEQQRRRRRRQLAAGPSAPRPAAEVQQRAPPAAAIAAAGRQQAEWDLLQAREEVCGRRGTAWLKWPHASLAPGSTQ